MIWSYSGERAVEHRELISDVIDVKNVLYNLNYFLNSHWTSYSTLLALLYSNEWNTLICWLKYLFLPNIQKIENNFWIGIVHFHFTFIKTLIPYKEVLLHHCPLISAGIVLCFLPSFGNSSRNFVWGVRKGFILKIFLLLWKLLRSII